ncbi:MAG: c-type cytochrome [Planctomycetes bacterium]|nr:c-type cytochrome [Planctomycetota bacterium]
MPWFWRVMCGLLIVSDAFAEELDYQVVDPELKVVRLDSSPDASFLSVRADSEGRLFVGGRKTLYAYDLDENGGYKPRHLLFEFPDHSWVNDIEIRGNDLYVVTVSAVYRLPEARVKRDGLTIERLLWGVPNGHVHQCFHACAWGPDGDLYVSMGDPLWYYGDFNRPDHWGHWTMFYRGSPVAERSGDTTIRVGDKEWAAMPYNGVGAVFRIRPDGTNLRSFARGLRNPCGLCFDKNWNLFTNDNDHEGIPALYAPGRLMHVTEGSYWNWPRGWMQSKSPDRADILPMVNEQMGRAVPVLQTYYADGYLPAKYENSLMVARWGRRQVTYFPLESQGSTFSAKEHVLLEGRDQARPVGVCVGRGGRVFVTVCYMAQNEGSPTYRSDLAVITRHDDPDQMPFEGNDVTNISASDLWKEIESPRRTVRNAAHQEILRRGGSVLTQAASRAVELQQKSEFANRPESPHILALESVVLSLPNRPYLPVWRQRDGKPIKAYVDPRNSPKPGWPAWLTEKTWSDLPEVQLNALLVSQRDPKTFPIDWLLPAALRSEDRYVSITAATIVANQPGMELLISLCQSSDHRDRMAGVIAAGYRLTIPRVDAKVPDEAPLSPQQKDEANVILFADEQEPIDLRKYGRVGNYTVAEHWNAAKTHSAEQEKLFALLLKRLDDEDDKVRLQAGHYLSLLNDARSETKVARVTATVQDKRLNLGKLEHLKPVIWTLGPVPDADGFKTVHPVETSPIDLSEKFQIDGKSFEWKQTRTTSPDRPLYDFRQLFGPSPNSSVYSYFRFEVPSAQRMQLLVGSEDGVKVWQNGKLVFENDVVRPLIQLDDVVTLALQPGSNDVLVRVRLRQGLGGEYFHYRHLGDVKLTIPDKPDGLSLADRLKSAGTGTAPVDPKFLDVDWLTAVKTGDVGRGKRLFAAESLGCAKCHAATPSQAGGGGPSLTDAGKRFTVAYMIESVLAPNKVISPIFKSTILELKDGRVVTGLIVSESAGLLEVLQPDTKRITVRTTEIEDRKAADVSAMPAGIVKTPEELRDVIAYLLSNPE